MPGSSSQEKLWNRSFTALTISSFFGSIAVWLLQAQIVEYCYNFYQLEYSIASLSLTVYIIVSLFTRLLLGHKIDDWGLKRSIIGAGLINIIASVLYLLPLPFSFFIVIRAVHGIGFAIFSGSMAAGAACILPPSRHAEGIGYFSVAQALANGVGPFIAAFLINGGFEFHSIFLLGFIANILSLAVVMVFVNLARNRVEPEFVPSCACESSNNGNPFPLFERTLGRFIQRSAIPLSIIAGLVFFCLGSLISDLSAYAAEAGFGNEAGYYFLIYSIVIVIGRVCLSNIADKHGENVLLFATLISLVLAFVLLTIAPNSVVFLLSAFFAGCGIGISQTTLQAVVVHMTPKNEQGRANSTFFAAMDLGSGIAPLFLGILIPFAGHRGVYGIVVVFALAALILYYLVHGRKHPKGVFAK